jgi:hypothetical protein
MKESRKGEWEEKQEAPRSAIRATPAKIQVRAHYGHEDRTVGLAEDWSEERAREEVRNAWPETQSKRTKLNTMDVRWREQRFAVSED